MDKIILFYRFTPLDDPNALRLWQQTLADQLQLKGRLIVGPQGINGTLGGPTANLKNYIRHTRQYTAFHDMRFQWSDGSAEDFPKLSVKVRPEIVTFAAAAEIHVNESGIVGGGQHLKPEQLHELLNKRGEEVVFFDGRNKHEAAIGKFAQAVVPDVEHTRDFIKQLDQGTYDDLKDKAVVTYCTGGIRCEVLSTLMKNRGFSEVYQLQGGIASYGEVFADEGLWEGSLYVFDKRLATTFSEKAKVIGVCSHCETKTAQYKNCKNTTCNSLHLVCQNCSIKDYCPSCLESRKIREFV